MAAVSGIIVKGSAYQCIPTMQLDFFKLSLEKNKTYAVGIDQSTTCMGIFILETNLKSYALLEIKREADVKEVFFRGIKGLLRTLFDGITVSSIVIEEPFPSKFAPTSSMILKELKGRVIDWCGEIPAFSGISVHTVYPQTWKSFIATKKVAKSMDVKVADITKSKTLMADAICNILPPLYNYKILHFAKDYDGFDACGILLGYHMYSHTSNGTPRICGIKEQRHVSFVAYFKIAASEIKDTESLKAPLQLALNDLNPVILAYNTSYNRHDNIRMATSNWNAVITILPPKYTEELCWQFNVDVSDGDVCIMYAIRKGRFSQKVMNYLEKALPCHELVTDR